MENGMKMESRIARDARATGLARFGLARRARGSRALRWLALALTFGFAGAAMADHVHCICGDGACTAAGHTHADLTWAEWTATDSLPNTAGNWYLANDVTLSSTYAPPTGVNLCLNGHVVKQTAATSVITVNTGVDLVLTDCQSETPHKYVVDSSGVWNWNDSASGGTVYESLTARPSANDVIIVKGGAITGGRAQYYGGGIHYKGNVSLYHVNVIGNKTTGGTGASGGGGLFNASASSLITLLMSGAKVIGNYSSDWGGGIHNETINGYKADTLRRIYMTDGAEISFNNVYQAGGAVYTYGYMDMESDSAIRCNRASKRAGGVAFAGAAMSVVDSQVIGNLTSGSEGGDSGGIWMSRNTLMVGGTTVMSNNFVKTTEVNNYLSSGVTIAVSPAKPLVAGAKIPVTTATTPTASAPVVISDASGLGYARFIESEKGFDVFNIGAPLYLGVQSCFYVSATGSDSNAGTVDAPLATLAAAYAKIAAAGSVGTIALLSDIDAPAGANIALTVADGKTVKITSAKADGTLLDNAEGDYTGVYTIHRANNTASLVMVNNGNLTFEQVVMTGDMKVVPWVDKRTGFLVRVESHASGGTLTLGVNSILRDNTNCGAYGNPGAEGGGVIFGTNGTQNNNLNMYMNANAAIIGCVAPRHGGAITIYDGDVYMTGNATMMYNAVEYGNYTSKYWGGGAVLAYGGHLHMSGNATITKNYVQLNGYTDSSRMHTCVLFDPDTVSKGYVSGNARIFDNYDDGHLTRNGDGTYTLTATKQANVYANAGYFYVDGAMGDTAKVGVTVQSAALNSIVANGTSAYTVTDADANQFFDDTETYKVTKSANTLIFGAEVVSTTLTLGTLSTTGLTGTFGQDIGATANDITVFKDGVKMDSGYTVTTNGTSVTIAFDPALPEKVTIGVAVSKNGYKVNDGAVTYAYNHKHCLCGDGTCTVAGHSHSDVNWQLWTSSTALPDTAGNWFLLSDVTLTTAYVPPTGVNLCLNGHVVKQTTAGQRVMYVSDSSSVVLTDCDQTSTHNFKVGSDGLWTLTTDAATTNYEDLVARPAAGAVVAVKGGAITGGNTGNSGFGGGIYSAGILSIYGGNVIGNMSGANQSGGGLYVGRNSWDSAGSTFTMFGGIVAGNYSGYYGGGISVNTVVIANVLGGDISFNVGQFGGGLEGSFAATCPVTVGGNLRLANNAHYTEGTPNNLYIYSGYPVAISTNTPFAATATIGVTTETKPSATTPLVAVTSNRGEDYIYFTGDEGYKVVQDAGVVKLSFEGISVFDVYKDGVFQNGYSSLSAACNAVASGAAGNWTIKANKDYTCTETDLSIDFGATKPTVLDTNGKTITAMANCRIFYISNGSVLTLAGAGVLQGNGTIVKGNFSWVSGALAVLYGNNNTATAPTLIIDGPTIRNFRSTNHGGALCVSQGGFIELRSGLITGCYSSNMGGGVVGLEGHAIGNTFTMTGGTICGNESGANGGVIAAHGASAKVYLLGGVISNNVCSTTGAGVDCVATVTVGGTFKCVDNVSASTKGDLYLPANQTLTVSTNTPFAAGAEIRVLTATKPSGATKVPVTSNRGEDLGYFASNEGYSVIEEDGVVKLAQSFSVSFLNKAASTDETIGDQPFTSPTNVTFVYGSSVDQVPAVAKSGAKFLGWTTSATGTTVEYTSDQIPTMTTTQGESFILYSVYGVEVGVPVFVALDECSTLPDDGRRYTFAITNVTSGAVLPTNCYASIVVPTNRGEACCTGYAADDPENPWRWMLTEGAFDYDIKQTTEARNDGEVLDDGIWGVTVTVNPNATPRYSVKSVYKHKVDDLGENSFDVVKAITSGEYVTAADVSVVNGKTKLVLGGDAVIGDHSDWRYQVNTAVLKGKFEIDFNQNFRVVGSFTPQAKDAPDGTCIGFLPSAAVPTSGQVFGASGNYLGYMTIPCFEKSLVLDFDNYPNGNENGDPGTAHSKAAPFFEHFSLTETGGDTGVAATSYCAKFATAKFADVSSRWPIGACTYLIENDTATTTLTFRVVLPSNETLNFVYTNAPAYFGSTKAYFFMSGSIRRGPANNHGCGALGTTAPSLEVLFDSFNYLGRADGYDSVTNVFVNRQEALVTYNAWGGQFADGAETNEIYAADAKAVFPEADPTRAGNYAFDGWYLSWTNGAAKTSDGGAIAPVADRTVYAKWISPSTPKDEGTNTLGAVIVGDGAVLTGAVKRIQGTDLAIPEFTSNGTETGVPYEIIRERAFAYRRYDKPVVDAAIASGMTKEAANTNRLTSVTIPTYVTNIQSYAFSDCQAMTNVTFSKTRDYHSGSNAVLYVGDWAFYNSSVRTVTFPAGSTVVLDYMAFANAEHLEDIYLLGDVRVASHYPFLAAGRSHVDSDGKQIPVKIHLSAKLASDAAYVAALTNGMTTARLVLDQTIEGEVRIVGTPVYTDPMSFTFEVSSDSPWLKVTTDTVYLFWSTTLSDNKIFIGNEPIKPKTLTGPDADGCYTATFDKPATQGGTGAFFQLCIGDPR